MKQKKVRRKLRNHLAKVDKRARQLDLSNQAELDALLFPMWDKASRDIDLAVTPGGRPGDASPLGKKGPRRLDDYVRMVAHALMRKGFEKSHAIATAKNSLKRWRRGGGHVRPQVRAGAGAHLGVQAALDKRGRTASLSNADGSGPKWLQKLRAKNPKCKYCADPATKVILHAEGMAYVATCASHLAKGRAAATRATPSGTPDPSNINGVYDLSVPAASAQDGPRVTMGAVKPSPALRRKIVREAARRRGFVPAKRGQTASLSNGEVVDLTGPKGYKHGWIYVGGAGLPAHKAARSNPFGKGKSRAAVVAAPKVTRTKSAPPARARKTDRPYRMTEQQMQAERSRAYLQSVANTHSDFRQRNMAKAMLDRMDAAKKPNPFNGLAADSRKGVHGEAARRAQARHDAGTGGGVHGEAAAALTPGHKPIRLTGNQSINLKTGEITENAGPSTKREIVRTEGLSASDARKKINAALTSKPAAKPLAGDDRFVYAPDFSDKSMAHLRGRLSSRNLTDQQRNAIKAEIEKRKGSASKPSGKPSGKTASSTSDQRFRVHTTQDGGYEVRDHKDAPDENGGRTIRTFKGKSNASKHANDLNTNKTVGRFDKRGAADRIDERQRVEAHANSPASRGTEDLQGMLTGGVANPKGFTPEQIKAELAKRGASARIQDKVPTDSIRQAAESRARLRADKQNNQDNFDFEQKRQAERRAAANAQMGPAKGEYGRYGELPNNPGDDGAGKTPAERKRRRLEQAISAENQRQEAQAQHRPVANAPEARAHAEGPLAGGTAGMTTSQLQAIIRDPKTSAADRVRAESIVRSRESRGLAGPQADNPQAFVGRASTQQLMAMLGDRRYASWKPTINAELSKRRKDAGSGGSMDAAAVRAEAGRRIGTMGTQLTEGPDRYNGTKTKNVHVDGQHAGHVYKGESRTPVMGRGSRTSIGTHVSKGYFAHVKRENGGGTEPIGHFKTQAAAVRAIEDHHKRKKGNS